jgi:decaprenylphospho-beta-D-erythro-pentofuranosid-2-ulose 2-reductase
VNPEERTENGDSARRRKERPVLSPRKVVFVGATRGIGRALARRLAERRETLFLLGRDAEQLERSAADLEARGAPPVGRALLDLERPEMFAPALAVADRALGGFDTAVVTAGAFAPQEALEQDRQRLRRLLDTSFTGVVLLCEELRERLLARGGGTLCVFSSVAGDRGRSPVVLYGAAKAGLSAYLEGLDHRYHRQGLRVVCVKPGFVRTAMTAGLPEPPFAGEPEAVARTVLAAIDQGRPVVYAPPIWRGVMAAVRHLPRAVMRRVGF